MQTRKFGWFWPTTLNSTEMLICGMDNCCCFCLAHEVIMQLNEDEEIVISATLKYLNIKCVVINGKICDDCLKYLKILGNFIDNYVTIDFTSTAYLLMKKILTSDSSVECYASLIDGCNSVNFLLANAQIEVNNDTLINITNHKGILPTPQEMPSASVQDAATKRKKLCKFVLGKSYCFICKIEQSLSFAQHKDVTQTSNGNVTTKLHLATICKMTIKEQDNLKKDIWKFGTGTSIACTVDDITSTPRDDMKINILTHISEKSYGCKICKKSFSRQSILKNHVRSIHTNERPYECTICKKSFSRKGSLKIHYRCHTNEKPYSCIKCNKSFSRKGSMKIHSRIHTNEKPYQCTICKRFFSNQSNLKTHHRSHTKERPFSCIICNKSFSRQDYMQRHLRCHTNEKLYQCTICKKSFSCQGYLKRHNQSHTNRKPDGCKICKERFSSQSDLTNNCRCYTNMNPYKCTICKQSLASKSNLKDYWSHTNGKPYECTICKKLFCYKSFLKVHERSHTNEKPYQCTICKKSFSCKSNCNNHYRTHSNEKPYECTICRKSFSLRQYLTKHYSSHTNEKPYQCTTCKK